QLGSQVQADVSDVGSETSRELRIAAVDRHQANDRRQQDVIDDLSIEVSSVRRNVDGVCSWRRWNRREQRDLLCGGAALCPEGRQHVLAIRECLRVRVTLDRVTYEALERDHGGDP